MKFIQKMRFIPSSVHGVMDYVMGGILTSSPWLGIIKKDQTQENDKINPEAIVPMGLGVGAGIYSMFTDYELGAVRKLPMKFHLAMDVMSGIFLAASPWLFKFNKKVWLPHLMLGVFEIGAGLFTKTEAEDKLLLV